jgi:hypothetical protein
MTRKAILTCAGIFLAVLGLISTGQRAWMVIEAEVMGVFSSIIAHEPKSKAERMICPSGWAYGEADAVKAMIYNADSEPHTYTVRFWVYSNPNNYDRSRPTSELTITILAQERHEIATSAIDADENALYQYARMLAYADEDLASPTTYQLWPQSFWGFCAMRLSSSPDYNQLKISALIGAGIVILGSGLIFFANRPFSGRKRLFILLIVLTILIVEGLLLLKVFDPAFAQIVY